MKIQAEISLYPLRQDHISEPIKQFIESIKDEELTINTGAMSSVITGNSDTVFKNLQKAFEHVAEKYQIVLTLKILESPLILLFLKTFCHKYH